MIWFKLGINLTPLFKLRKDDKCYFHFDKQLIKNKFLEVKFLKLQNVEFSVLLDTQVAGRDYGGLQFSFQFWRWCLCIDFYDERAWDYQYNTWDENFSIKERRDDK